MAEILDPFTEAIPIPRPAVRNPVRDLGPQAGDQPPPRPAAPSLGAPVIVGSPSAPVVESTPHGAVWGWLKRLNEYYRNSPMEQALRGGAQPGGVTTIESAGGWGPDPRAPTGTQVLHPAAKITPGSTKSQERVPQEGGAAGGKGGRLDRPGGETGKGDRGGGKSQDRPGEHKYPPGAERWVDHRGRGIPPQVRQLFEQLAQGAGGRAPPIFDFLMRALEGASQGGESPFADTTGDGTGGIPSFSAEEPSDHNILSSGGGVAPGAAAGGSAAGGPDTPAGAATAPTPGGTGAEAAPVAPGDGATSSISADPAVGGTSAVPLPPIGAVVPPLAAPAVGGVQRTPYGSPANPPAVGLAPLGAGTGALGTIGRAREAAETAAMGAAAGVNFGQGMNPRLAADRERYRIELQNDPALRERFLDIMFNEQGRHPEGIQAVAESALNRASVRKTSLRRQLGWHRWEPHGYYQRGNAGRGRHRHMDALNRALENALAGSNISNFATDNSSGGLASRERRSGRFRYRSGYTGESFFAPGWAEPKFARDWDHWVSGMQGAETAAQ